MGAPSFQVLIDFYETRLRQNDPSYARDIRVGKDTDKSLSLFFTGLVVVSNA